MLTYIHMQNLASYITFVSLIDSFECPNKIYVNNASP